MTLLTDYAITHFSLKKYSKHTLQIALFYELCHYTLKRQKRLKNRSPNNSAIRFYMWLFKQIIPLRNLSQKSLKNRLQRSIY